MNNAVLMSVAAVAMSFVNLDGAFAQKENAQDQNTQAPSSHSQKASDSQQHGQKSTNQNASIKGPLASARVVSLEYWNYDDLYRNGWGAEQLIDTTVVSPNGEEIGEVENILVGPNGNIRSVIVAAGGFLEIGDAHFAVPWNKVKVSPGIERVTVPITEANYGDYDLFGENGYDVRAKPDSGVRRVEEGRAGDGKVRAWRVTELMGDFARLKDQNGYGYVDDLVFDTKGKLMAVLVEPRFTADSDVAGPYAYPYYGYGYGFDPGLDYYGLPYDSTDVTTLDQFDYERMNTAAANSENSTAESGGDRGSISNTGSSN